MWKQFRGLAVLALPIVCLLLHPAGAPVVLEAANLLDQLAKFCPDVDVCPERVTNPKNWNETARYPGQVACCTKCSCDDACVYTNNCCFPPTDRHPESTCLYPTTQLPSEGNALPYKSYRMVDRDAPANPSRNTLDISDLQNADQTPCGDVSQPPFGTLLPVYSKQQNKIYKNPTCAKSHDVKDGVIWEAKIFCINWRHPQGSTAFQMLEYGIIAAGCSVDFTYPGNEADLDLHMCYRDVKQSCDRDTFPIPERLNVTATQVRAMCESGFISPWHIQDILFANVFCIICNNENPRLFTDTMKGCYTDDKIRHEGQGLSFLLHMNQFGEREQMSNVIMPEVCDGRQGLLNLSWCRDLKCPVNQLRGPNGICAFMVYKKEDTNNYIIVVRVHIENFKISSNDDFKERMDELIRLWNEVNPWPQQGNVHCELTPNNSSSTQVKSLLVEIMVSPHRHMPFQAFLMNVKSYLNKRWVIKANGSYITLHQTWAKFSKVVLTLGMLDNVAGFYRSFPKFYTVLNSSDLLALNITEPLMLYLRVPQTRLITIPATLYLTKLYYCEQIELKSHEFIAYKVEHVNNVMVAEALFNKLTGRVMFENEFLLVRKADDGIVARICLSDSGLKKKIPTTTSGAEPVHVGLVFVLTLAWSGLQMLGF